jgi:hypothetical protein
MPGLLDLLTQSLGGDTTDRLGRQLGLSPQQTQGALGAALPMLLTGLARNAATPEGAGALHGALARDHDGSLLDDLGGLIAGTAGGGRATNGAGILGHVLGARQGAAQQAVAGAAGIDAAQAGQLLAALAPMVMGALGRTQRQQGLDAGGLAAMLGGVQHQQVQAHPDLMGLANRLLDRDGDGSAVDDIVQGLGSLFGKR